MCFKQKLKYVASSQTPKASPHQRFCSIASSQTQWVVERWCHKMKIIILVILGIAYVSKDNHHCGACGAIYSDFNSMASPYCCAGAADSRLGEIQRVA
jgi:hypothetical protein